MCQHIIQFCSGSTKPLLFAGSFLLLLLAVAIGYTGCSSNALYQDIDPLAADKKSLLYYLQLFGAGYLALITLLASFAAYYDQKHSIRALSLITSVNFVVSAAAIFMVPTGQELVNLFADRLTGARELYDFTDKPPLVTTTNLSVLPDTLASEAINRTTRETSSSTEANGASNGPVTKLQVPPTEAEATRMWDRLQARGCCGLKNATEEWKKALPKSCCNQPIIDQASNKTSCKSVDEFHNHPCLEVIGATSMNMLMVLALIALVSLYLATVTGISTYRTFHYNEASQNAYS